jgi:Rps23 Pro-64 3,4-dihydroxylase Tpa1-like proline 4-hydroxylase
MVSDFPENIKVLFDVFKSKEMIELISQISSIPSLEADPKLHGCGLHAHPKNGRLFVHLDYEKHPILQNKERRINIILYVSKNWKPEWNGATELWNNKLVKKSEVIFNNALIFQLNDFNKLELIERKITQIELNIYGIRPYDKLITNIIINTQIHK